MEAMDGDLQALIQGYFDCGWEEFENDSRIQEKVAEMKKLADMYLKAKSSKSGGNMVALVAMEAELGRLKEELIEVVESLKEESEKQQEAELETEAETQEDGQGVDMPVKSKSNKQTLIAIVLAGLALIASGAAIFMSTSNNVSLEDFESFQKTMNKKVKLEVDEASQATRTEIDTLTSTVQALKQDIDTAKKELSAGNLEMSDRVTAQVNEVSQKMALLQESMKKVQPKKVVAPTAKKPELKPAPKPTPRKR